MTADDKQGRKTGQAGGGRARREAALKAGSHSLTFSLCPENTTLDCEAENNHSAGQLHDFIPMLFSARQSWSQERSIFFQGPRPTVDTVNKTKYKVKL